MLSEELLNEYLAKGWFIENKRFDLLHSHDNTKIFQMEGFAKILMPCLCKGAP